MTRRDEWAIAIFGSWMITGLYVDGWAHQTDRPESFFTPWHALLYSGFTAAVIYFSADGLRQRFRGDVQARSGPDDRLVAAGLVLFITGAVGDFVWHEIFGIEVDLEALLSPTHLALMFGGVLMVSGPLRSAWSRPDDASPPFVRFLPTVASVTIAVMAVSFFTMYLSAFRFGGLFFDPGFQGELQQTHAIASVLTTNLLLVAAIVLVMKRWRPPLGTFMVVYGAVGTSMVLMDSFAWPQLIIVALAGGLAADVGARWGARAAAVAAPVVTWTTWFVSFALTGRLRASPEFVSGTIFLATISAWAFAEIALRQASAARPAEPPPSMVASSAGQPVS